MKGVKGMNDVNDVCGAIVRFCEARGLDYRMHEGHGVHFGVCSNDDWYTVDPTPEGRRTPFDLVNVRLDGEVLGDVRLVESGWEARLDALLGRPAVDALGSLYHP